MTTDLLQSSPANRFRKWRAASDGGARGEWPEPVGEMMAGLREWLASARSAAQAADGCRRLERELREPVSASFCKQHWAGLLARAKLEELAAVELPPSEPQRADDDQVVRNARRLEEHLRKATAQLDRNVRELALHVDALAEPATNAELPLLPSSVVDLPAAVVGQLVGRLGLLEECASRLRWLYDRLAEETLRLLQVSLSWSDDDEPADAM